MPGITTKYAKFNGFNFNLINGAQVLRTDTPGQAKRSLNIFTLARRNARKLSSGWYDKNTLNVKMYIALSSRAELDKALDQLYANIQADEGTLVVPMSGVERAYTATYSDTIIDGEAKGGFMSFTLVFECSDSFGYDTTYSLIRSSTGITAAILNTQYTQGGSAREQAPYVEIQYTAAPTGAASKTVNIGNGTQSIAITRTWLQYDLIQIDLRAESVKVNGVEVDFSGALWKNGIGLQTINYSDNFTTRTFRILTYVYNRYV